MVLALRLLPQPPLPRPTELELDALRSTLTRGSRKGAAADLDISDSTVKERLKGLYRRIDVLDRAQAVAWMDDHYPGWRGPMP